MFMYSCMFCSVYSVSLCCSAYFLCVNAYCTSATGCQSTQLQLTKYISIYISIQHLTDNVHVQGCKTSGCQVAVATEFSTVSPNICTVHLTFSCHPSGAYNFNVQPIFLENTSTWTPAHVYPLEQSHVQHRRHAFPRVTCEENLLARKCAWHAATVSRENEYRCKLRTLKNQSLFACAGEAELIIFMFINKGLWGEEI
jgi:hypothetical protein